MLDDRHVVTTFTLTTASSITRLAVALLAVAVASAHFLSYTAGICSLATRRSSVIL